VTLFKHSVVYCIEAFCPNLDVKSITLMSPKASQSCSSFILFTPQSTTTGLVC